MIAEAPPLALLFWQVQSNLFHVPRPHVGEHFPTRLVNMKMTFYAIAASLMVTTGTPLFGK